MWVKNTNRLIVRITVILFHLTIRKDCVNPLSESIVQTFVIEHVKLLAIIKMRVFVIYFAVLKLKFWYLPVRILNSLFIFDRHADVFNI